MALKNKKEETDYGTIILSVIGLTVVIAMLSDLFKDVKKNTSSDVVSDEGKEILGDARKRENLQAAVDHYRKEGNWDLLHKVAE